MNHPIRRAMSAGLVLLVAAAALVARLPLHQRPVHAASVPAVTGRVVDQQGEPIRGAHVALYIDGGPEPAAETETAQDGAFILDLPEGATPQQVAVEIEHPHYTDTRWEASPADVERLQRGAAVRIPDVTLARQLTIGFWVATATFAGMLLLIATERLHSTMAALLGVALVLGTSLVGQAFSDQMFIATRGGEASYRTQDAAIALAKEEGRRLRFLFVVDMCFLDRTSRAVRPDVVRAEIARMGEFLLDMAQERATAQGVTAERAVRYGTLEEELKAAAQEEDVGLVLLGKPARGRERLPDPRVGELRRGAGPGGRRRGADRLTSPRRQSGGSTSSSAMSKKAALWITAYWGSAEKQTVTTPSGPATTSGDEIWVATSCRWSTKIASPHRPWRHAAPPLASIPAWTWMPPTRLPPSSLE